MSRYSLASTEPLAYTSDIMPKTTSRSTESMSPIPRIFVYPPSRSGVMPYSVPLRLPTNDSLCLHGMPMNSSVALIPHRRATI